MAARMADYTITCEDTIYKYLIQSMFSLECTDFPFLPWSGSGQRKVVLESSRGTFPDTFCTSFFPPNWRIRQLFVCLFSWVPDLACVFPLEGFFFFPFTSLLVLCRILCVFTENLVFKLETQLVHEYPSIIFPFPWSFKIYFS